MPVNMNSRVVRTQHVVTAPVEDELVMADVDAGKYYAFDGIATAIWERMEEEISVEDLCIQLREVFDVSPEQCTRDVSTFLDVLESKGLIRQVP